MRTSARLIVAAFCWMTAAYAFVASSAFAYLQFVRPRVFPWVGQFSDWHRAASIPWLALVLLVVWPDLRSRDARVRAVAVAGLAMIAAFCSWNLVRPVLPNLSSGARSIEVGIASLLPLLWLSALDHLRAARYLRSRAPLALEDDLRAFEHRTLVAALTTGALLTLIYAVLTSLALAGRFEPDLLLPGLAAGFGASFVQHLAVLTAAFLVAALLFRLTRRSFISQYGALAAGFVLVLSTAFDRLVGHSLSFHGAAAALAAVATALSVVGTWTGMRLTAFATAGLSVESALDLFFGRRVPTADRLSAVARVFGIGLLAYGASAVSALADWDFVILQVGVLAVWLCAFGAIHRLMPRLPNLQSWVVAAACLLPLGAVAAIGATARLDQSLGRYAVYNPSFRATDGLLRSSGSAHPSFDRYLQANTGLTDVPVAPVEIDFVFPTLSRAAARRPLLFLFVIDSLRPDYLAPYNASVGFTPRIAQFAAESTVFTNAFTAFGGTGLSVPAMWAGASIVHKQYAKPFHPMNALEKLLDANDYRRMLGLDSIMVQLLEPSSRLDELDRGRSNMDFEFCRTLDELQAKLEAVDTSTTPVFAYSMPQDIHMSRLPRQIDGGEELRGFYPPYATKVRALDPCFGRFVDGLKRLGLYDRSLVVLTADHGEMLGEDGRFGHSYHLFPQVVQVPLIVHFPSGVDRGAIDADAVSRTIDITPTIYAALGYRTERPSGLMGRPLIGVDARQSTERRRETTVIAASYGAVYAAVRHNGRRLYIADGIRGGDQAFERSTDGHWVQAEVTEGLRAINQLAIRQHVDEIARTYQLGERQ